jgi:hypothetical protein
MHGQGVGGKSFRNWGRSGSHPLQLKAAPAIEETSTLYQLEYVDSLAAGDLVTESGYSAADAVIHLRSLLALGMSPITVRVVA